MKKERVFISEIPDFLNEWDNEKNSKMSLFPDKVSFGSSSKVWWICPKGHSYQSRVSNRTILKRGCPYCAGRYAIKGENDLESVNPQLAKQWADKNEPLSPSDVLPNSNKKVWWICDKGHLWEASIHSRNIGAGCPICAQILVSNETCLAKKNPELAEQWHPTKNGKLTPYDVMPNSNLKVWWICAKGHEFQSTVGNKKRHGLFSCPICHSELKTSFPEQAIYFYVTKLYPESVNRYLDNGYELDVFIPNIRTGIEYDGMMYHTNNTEQKEKKKDTYFKNLGIRVIHVKEYKDEAKKAKKADVVWIKVDSSYSNLNETIYRILLLISDRMDVDVNINRDSNEIYSKYLSNERNTSIEKIFPELLNEWDYSKNGQLNPEYVSFKSHKKIWWRCSKGHSYQNSPYKRTERNQGCPYCSGRYATKENNLLVYHPDICKEWDYELNCDEKPENYTPVSGKKVWWKCQKCNHEWQATIGNRTRGNGCPKCADILRRNNFNDSIVKKNGSFADNYPELLEEWDYNKNVVSPENISSHNKIKVWWICKKCNSEWNASVSNRSNGRGCPVCAKRIRAEKRGRAVRQYSINGDFIKEYPSAVEAKKETGAGSITVCCLKKCKTSGGYIWRYADDDNTIL